MLATSPAKSNRWCGVAGRPGLWNGSSSGDIKRRLHAVDYDQALAIVARGYYHAELDEKALQAATPAIKRSGAKAPMALWWSDLAAWRSGDYARSAQNFEMLSAAALEDDWIKSAAAFGRHALTSPLGNRHASIPCWRKPRRNREHSTVYWRQERLAKFRSLNGDCRSWARLK